jgi:hypothetical protein
MRVAVILLASCVLYAQTGKPGVTEPIKDPQQVPGKAHPGPIPRETPQPAASAAKEKAPAKKTTKKSGKTAKDKASRSER